ncbi:MAG: SHD1 domain-containing protein [Kiritimatiellia bacterium]
MSHPFEFLKTAWLVVALLVPVRDTPARTWTDVGGRKIEAEYVSSDGKTVVLKSTATGKEIKVPLDRLSLSDKAGVLLKIREERVKDAGDSAPPDAAEHAAPAPSGPDPVEDDLENMSKPPMDEKELREMLDVPGEKQPDPIGGFTSFAKPMNAAGIAGEIRETGWPLFLLGLAVQGLILMYIAAIGLHITSIFLDFKETFGTACLVGLGSIGFRALIGGVQAWIVSVDPSLADVVAGSLTSWFLLLGLIYPFDVFLIRRIYQADAGTSMRAAFLYIVWGRVIVLLIGVVLAAAATSGTDGLVPPGLDR